MEALDIQDTMEDIETLEIVAKIFLSIDDESLEWYKRFNLITENTIVFPFERVKEMKN